MNINLLHKKTSSAVTTSIKSCSIKLETPNNKKQTVKLDPNKLYSFVQEQLHAAKENPNSEEIESIERIKKAFLEKVVEVRMILFYFFLWFPRSLKFIELLFYRHHVLLASGTVSPKKPSATNLI